VGLTCPAAPAGVSHFRSNQPKTVFVQERLKNNNLLEKSQMKKASLQLVFLCI
jgi:hypothetical protein